MDKLRLFQEILHLLAQNKDFRNEMQELLYPKLINFTSNSLNLRVILQITDECGFNMSMFNINNMEEHYDTTDEVRTFIQSNNIDEAQEFLNFLDTYRNQGFYIKFRIKDNTAVNGEMTEFTYSDKDSLQEGVK